MSATPAAARPAPRTWFSRPPQGTRDADQEAFLTLGAAMVVLVAPLVVVVAVAVYGLGRLTRLRWWIPALGAVPAAVVSRVGWGTPAVLAARYGAGYRHLWAATGDNLAHLPGAIGHGWVPLAGALAPLSVPVALVVAAGGLGYAELRRPAWRDERRTHRKTVRRVARTRRALQGRTSILDDQGRLPLGVDLETGAVVALGEAERSIHAVVAGASGSGKTTALLLMVEAAVASGRPTVVVDMKADPDIPDRVGAIAEAAGVPWWLWSLDGGATWDPLAHGDKSQLKDKLVGLEAWDGAAIHYKLSASRYVQLVFGALGEAGRRPDLAEVVSLLDPKKAAAFVRTLPEGAGDALLAYADSLTADQRSGVAGLATRLAVLTESTAGPSLRPGPGAIDLAELVTGDGGGIVVFSLCSGRYPETAAMVGKLVVQDLKAVCGTALQRRPRRGWSVIVDEFGGLDSSTHLLGLLARGRAAGCSVTLATQELADLEVAGPGFRDQVLGNASLKVAFRQDVPASAELWAEIVGTEAAWVETIQTAHRSAGLLAPATGHATGAISLRSAEQFIRHPNLYKRLPQGRCVVITKHPAFSTRLCDVVIPTATNKAAAA